jgi:small subunit ribosomal protein S1
VGQEVEVQVLRVDKDKKKIALSIKKAEVDPWTTVQQRYTPGQVVSGVVTKIAPFGAFARIEDGIEGLIHESELAPGMDLKASMHEGQQLQLRILRIDAERRRLGLSLRQADEMDSEKPAAEAEVPEAEPVAAVAEKSSSDKMMMSLEDATPHVETVPAEKEPRRERRERAERPNDNPLLSNLSLGDEGETTAMAEAFRLAARQRTKEESETTSES